MLYESACLGLRLALFAEAKAQNCPDLPAAVGAGVASQLLTLPLFVRHVANHTTEVGKQYRWVAEGKFIGALAGRGACLGLTHLYVYEKMRQII